MAYSRPAKRNNFRGRRNNNYTSNNQQNNSQQGSVVDFKTYKKYQANREKYIELARNALSNGDRVEAENFFQHADHYLRLINLSSKYYENNRETRGEQQAQPNSENVNNNSAEQNLSTGNTANPSESNEENLNPAKREQEINPAESSAEARLPGFITN